jgi:hypothetical protein
MVGDLRMGPRSSFRLMGSGQRKREANVGSLPFGAPLKCVRPRWRGANTGGMNSALQLEVNRVAFGGESGFVDDLAHGGVGVDGGVDFLAGEFLVEGKAHFGDELGGVLADDVCA